MLDPPHCCKPLADSWPTYSGDYTGQRFSALTQVNQATVKNLTLAWTGGADGGPANGFGGGSAPVIVGGEGTGEFASAATPTSRARC